MTTYHYIVHSNAAPFFSERDSGFIEAKNPMEALKKVVKEYTHPSGIYSAIVSECTPKNKTLARYLSKNAATQDAAPTGAHSWKNHLLYVDGVKQPTYKERYELVVEE